MKRQIDKHGSRTMEPLGVENKERNWTIVKHLSSILFRVPNITSIRSGLLKEIPILKNDNIMNTWPNIVTLKEAII